MLTVAVTIEGVNQKPNLISIIEKYRDNVGYTLSCFPAGALVEPGQEYTQLSITLQPKSVRPFFQELSSNASGRAFFHNYNPEVLVQGWVVFGSDDVSISIESGIDWFPNEKLTAVERVKGIILKPTLEKYNTAHVLLKSYAIGPYNVDVDFDDYDELGHFTSYGEGIEINVPILLLNAPKLFKTLQESELYGRFELWDQEKDFEIDEDGIRLSDRPWWHLDPEEEDKEDISWSDL